MPSTPVAFPESIPTVQSSKRNGKKKASAEEQSTHIRWHKPTQTYTLSDDEMQSDTPEPVRPRTHHYYPLAAPINGWGQQDRYVAPGLMAASAQLVVPTLNPHGFVHEYPVHMPPNTITSLRVSPNGLVQHWAYAGLDGVAHLTMIASVSSLQNMYSAMQEQQDAQRKS